MIEHQASAFDLRKGKMAETYYKVRRRFLPKKFRWWHITPYQIDIMFIARKAYEWNLDLFSLLEAPQVNLEKIVIPAKMAIQFGEEENLQSLLVEAGRLPFAEFSLMCEKLSQSIIPIKVNEIDGETVFSMAFSKSNMGQSEKLSETTFTSKRRMING